MDGVKAARVRAKLGWVVAVSFKKRVTNTPKIELLGRMMMYGII